MTEINFGTPPQVFNPSKKDEEIIKTLKDAGYDANSCMQCGMCTASCLSGRWTAMRTRHIMWRAAHGDASVLEDPDIWLCTTCYACFDRCPRDLKVTDAIIELRNLASLLPCFPKTLEDTEEPIAFFFKLDKKPYPYT